MKAQFSGLGVTNLRGSMGGTVASRNKSGDYLRRKGIPTNPQTEAQQLQRALFSSLSTAWRTLTEPVREAWREAAVNFPVVDVFGNPVILNGNSLFLQLNANLAKVGIARIDTPPLVSDVANVIIDEVIVEAEGGVVSLTFDSVVPAGMAALISATQTISAGRRNFKNLLRNIGTVTAGATGLAVTTSYTNTFGAPITGGRVGFSVETVNIETGQSSVQNYISGIVTAP